MKNEIIVSRYGAEIELAILEVLSDNRILNREVSFSYDEESESEIDNVLVTLYECNEKCSLEQAIEGCIKEQFNGTGFFTGQEYGYSDYTIEGFNINEFRLGNHDLKNIFKSKKDKYLHFVLSF